jgi:hypothetical protein
MVVCADGKYQTATGQSSCDDCPAGQKCTSKSGAAVDCAAGYFSPLGVSTCTVCIYVLLKYIKLYICSLWIVELLFIL